jgi:hypothetical protein
MIAPLGQTHAQILLKFGTFAILFQFVEGRDRANAEGCGTSCGQHPCTEESKDDDAIDAEFEVKK